MIETSRVVVCSDYVVSDPEIMGGSPVIRGTRITVHSLLERLEHGESIDDLIIDNPDVPREAIEEAIAYAKSHPSTDHSSGRPWRV